jgi:tripartite-type tricarboxylate transporter receptor subunit TctC
VAVARRIRACGLPRQADPHHRAVRGFESSTYTGIALPAATPKDVVMKVQDAVLKVLDQPAVRQNFERLGAEVIKSTPEQFVRRVQDDYAKWVRIRKTTGIKLE